jgi:putative transposase
VPVPVSPTGRIRGHIDELFAQDRPLPEILEEVARLGAQLLMQAALEAEVTEFLGRDRYQRAALAEDARPGSRNGYREVTVRTTAGPVALARPKLRGTTEAFASCLFGSHVTRTNALESLGIASFVRGLSVRDVEATLADALGDQAAISKSTVSAICQQMKEEYQAWARRSLDAIKLDYLFLDASFFRMHPGSPAEPVLAAWGITTDGKPAFIGLGPGTGESFDAWHDFLADLRDRGLSSPLLIISDGAAGLIGAIEQIYPKALRQRCLVHRARNIAAKVPAGVQAEVKDAYWKIFHTSDLATGPGPELVEIIDARISEMAAKYSAAYPSAMKCLTTDREGLTAYLRSPPSTITGCGTPTSSSAPSARPAAGSKSSAGSPARQLPHPGLGGPGPGLGRLARIHHDQRRPAAAPGPAPLAARTAPPATATRRGHHRRRHARNCQSDRVISPMKRNPRSPITPDSGRHLAARCCSASGSI